MIHRALAGLGLTLALSATNAQAATAPAGVWLTQSGNLEVELAPCGPAICGTVVRVLANKSMSNPNATIAEAPAMGMKILTDLRAQKDGAWVGKIFNRENGKTYDCRVTLPAPDKMELRAYIVNPAIGQTQVWTKVR